jgi:hypothetical protein
MEQLTSCAKIAILIKETIENKKAKFIEQLNKGDLYGFENALWEQFLLIYNQLCEEYMRASAAQVAGFMREQAGRKRLGKLVKRKAKVQLRTGYYASVEGVYAKKAPKQHKGSRHLLHLHWKVQKSASPAYYSLVCLFSVLCPSFEVAGQVIGIQGVEYNLDRIKELSCHLANQCKGQQAALSRAPGESLKGKRVVIGIDGGRTRTRQYNGNKNKKGNATFDTPWVEPKMFVIDVLKDDDGQVDRTCLPIYGCLFGDDEIMELLASHLSGLQIKQVAQVQVVADGSPWIWNRVRAMLEKLGVEPGKITETLDYYHATEYVAKILAGLPKKFLAQADKLSRQFKDWIWAGNVEAIVDKCEQLFSKPSPEIIRYVGYFQNNQKRMQYADYLKNKLMCGSGIIESGIRRVINLRFKNASAFWKKENVESLYFLRGILLSFRWNIMMNNLVYQEI